MFKPLAMLRLRIQVMDEDAPLLALILAESSAFKPEQPELSDDILPANPASEHQRLLRQAMTRLNKIRQHIQVPKLPDTEYKAIQSQQKLGELNERLGAIWGEYSAMEAQQHKLSEARKHIDKLRQTLQIFSNLDLDLAQLQGAKQFLVLHIGTLPLQDLPRFEKAVSLEPHHYLSVFQRSEDLAYVLVAGPPQEDEVTRKLLKTADFHPLSVPEEFSAHPNKLKADLNAQAEYYRRDLKDLDEQIADWAAHYRQEVAEITRKLRYIEPYASLSGTLRGGHSGLNLVEGWMPAQALPKLRKALDSKLGERYLLETREPSFAEHDQVPSLLEHNRFFQAFEGLVKNFGLPRYDEFDPTVLFGVSFILMFGMMFGDVGHGAMIAGAAYLFRERLGKQALLVGAVGIASTLFGFIYGSIFGYEHVLPALWMSPLSDPMLMLTVALIWGVAFILIACLLKFYNLILQQHYKAALFDNQGLAGIVFYVASLWGVFQLVQGQFSQLNAALMLLPFASIIAFKWHEQQDSRVGERIIMVAIEAFETVMNYLSNTLSFMRVAAFSLNHAALAIAVFAIAHGMDSFGHWLTIILGNLFILILEGAIVAIQVLRLEYYEGFARFFSGNGRSFTPLKLRY